MIRSLFSTSLLAMFIGLAGCASTRVAPASMKLRVLTYNIHHGAGEDGRIDLPRIAEIIRRSGADLVALQEVDVRTARSGSDIDQAQELGRLTVMSAHFGKAMDYQGGEYGQAILSRSPVGVVRVERLPGEANAEPRIAVIATIPGADGRPEIAFAGTHLDHQREASRVSQARRLHEAIPAEPGRLTILAGDLNAGPGSETLRMLSPEWQDATPNDALTYPAASPRKKIDWILFRSDQPWRVVSAQVLDEPTASDHRPVLVEFELRRR
jgi:endonuclease/exonuclease/phosphatase family metal-dependent hydrolase